MRLQMVKILFGSMLTICGFTSTAPIGVEYNMPAKENLKAIVFDYGGVLAKISMKTTVPFMAKEFEVDNSDIQNVFKYDYAKHRMDMFSDQDFWELVSKGLNKPIPEGINERYKVEIYEMLQILSDKKEHIKTLKEKGYKVYMLSNQYPHFNEVLKDQKVFDLFDLSVVSCDYGIKKPTLKLYQILLDQIPEKSDQCLFVDDTYENISAAKRLGFQTFYYNVFKHGKELFDQVMDELKPVK